MVSHTIDTLALYNTDTCCILKIREGITGYEIRNYHGIMKISVFT